MKKQAFKCAGLFLLGCVIFMVLNGALYALFDIKEGSEAHGFVLFFTSVPAVICFLLSVICVILGILPEQPPPVLGKKTVASNAFQSTKFSSLDIEQTWRQMSKDEETRRQARIFAEEFNKTVKPKPPRKKKTS